MTSLTPVFLVGIDTIQGLQAARIFARRGVPVIAIASGGSYYTTKTRVCEQTVFLDGRDMVSVLLELADGLPVRPFLLPCHDRHVEAISEHREVLDEKFAVALPPDSVVRALMDKTEFARYAEEIGLSVPPTWVVHDLTELETIEALASFPLVVKPSIRTSRWMTEVGEKAVRVDDLESLTDIVRRGLALEDALLVQEWIEGDDGDLYSCNGVFRDGAPLATFTARKLRQWPPRNGQSCLGIEVRCDEVLHQTELLAEATEYTGMLYVETKRDPVTGRHFVIEPNVGRPTGRSAIAEAGGVELLMTAYCDALGLDLPDQRIQSFTGVKWIHLLRDSRSAVYYLRRGELSVRDWISSIRGRKAFAVWSLRDPLPFLSAVWSGLRGVS